MRRESPTGGALGQVAVMELQMLQSVLSSLDAGQDSDMLTKNLKKVKTHYQNFLDYEKRIAAGETELTAADKARQGSGAAPAAPAAPTAPASIPTFANLAEAEAAGLKPGTKVIINGEKGTVR